MTAALYLEAADRLTAEEGTEPWTALMRVLLVELRAASIPLELAPKLEDADRYWSTSEGDLMSAKEGVWDYIRREFPSGNDLVEADGRIARALLCVLEPKGNDEARSMTAEWFAAMAGAGSS